MLFSFTSFFNTDYIASIDPDAHVIEQSLTRISFNTSVFKISGHLPACEWPMFGGLSGTTPEIAFRVLTKEVPNLVLATASKSNDLNCSIMREFSSQIVVRSSSITLMNNNFGSQLLLLLAQNLHYNYKKFHARIPSGINWNEMDQIAIQTNVQILYDYVTWKCVPKVCGISYPVKSIPSIGSEISMFRDLIYKANRGIALTWEAYVTYKKTNKKGGNQNQLMFVNHFYLLQHFTSHLKVSNQNNLVNYEELDVSSKISYDERRPMPHPLFVCYGGRW